MYMFFCDGSTKKSGNVVISVVVTKFNKKYERIESVIYCYKETVNPKDKNINELLACLVGISLLKDLNLEGEDILIINDNISNIALLREFKKGMLESIKFKDDIIKNILNRIQNTNLEKISFKQLPRTTLGMNLADYLNYEENSWVRDKDKKNITINFNKIINRPYDYNLSSKAR